MIFKNDKLNSDIKLLVNFILIILTVIVFINFFNNIAYSESIDNFKKDKVIKDKNYYNFLYNNDPDSPIESESLLDKENIVEEYDIDKDGLDDLEDLIIFLDEDTYLENDKYNIRDKISSKKTYIQLGAIITLVIVIFRKNTYI